MGSIRGSIARPVVENEHFAVSPERFYDLSTTEPIIAAEFIIKLRHAGGHEKNTQHEKYLLGTGATEAAGLGGALKHAGGQEKNTQHITG